VLFLVCSLLATPAEADRLFTCGFEENDFLNTMWTVTSGTQTITTTPVHSGTYALEFLTGGDESRDLVAAKTSGTLWYRIEYYKDTTIAAAPIARWFNNNTIELLAGGTIRLTNTVTSSFDDSSITLVADTWYTIEVEFVISDTVGSLTLRVDGTQEAQITSEDTLATSVSRFAVQSSFNKVQSFDDIIINDEAGSAPFNTWPGESKIFLLEPSGDNTITWDRIPTDTTNWDRVDDLPGAPDDSTTYIHTTVNETDKLDLTNLGAEVPSDADIISLDVYGRQGSNGTTGTRVIDFELWDEADSQNTLVDVSAKINGWKICDTDEHLVFDAGSRSKANIDSFRVGYSRSIGGGNEIRITAQWVNVEWIEAAAGPAFRPKVVVY
jgi:hypothetical protein